MNDKDFWVFGYGSLMWNPGFDHVEARHGRLFGYHRALCIYSWVHRGTEDKPGLVLGLDRGGSCHGVAFRVAGEKRQDVIAYLDAREMMNNVYRPVWGSVRLAGTSAEMVKAYTFVADPANPQYAGGLSDEESKKLIAQGKGQSGACVDYIANTLEHLQANGISDRTLSNALSGLPALD